MLSLPLILPQDDQSTWMRTTYRPRSDSPPPATGRDPQQTHRLRQQRDEEKRLYNAKSPLAMLAADEAAIAQRKAAVRNFGSHWIRPPGVPKTLQAMTEEALEREEQAELERQEMGLRDMQAQQQLAEAQQQAAEAAQADVEGGEAERNLDDEIPDADATTADVTFNEDSIIEGSQIEQGENVDLDQNESQFAEMEEAELTGAARDEEDLGLDFERDLDDSVPEAGSYQHTDTEAEDSDSESELRDSFAGRSSRRSLRLPHGSSVARGQMEPPPMMGLQDRIRAQVASADNLPRSPGSLNLSSSMIDSSMVGGSPLMHRAHAGARGGAGRRRQGRHS